MEIPKRMKAEKDERLILNNIIYCLPLAQSEREFYKNLVSALKEMPVVSYYQFFRINVENALKLFL
jgi:hypothetical protein